ncbi:hypothetical protein [Pseudoxanthomonas mexicana]
MNSYKSAKLAALLLYAGFASAQAPTGSACTEDELVKASLEEREFRVQTELEVKAEIDRILKENYRKISVLGANVFCSNTDLYQRALTRLIIDISNSYSSGDKASIQFVITEELSEAVPIQVQGVVAGLQMSIMPVKKKDALCEISSDLANDIINSRPVEP